MLGEETRLLPFPPTPPRVAVTPSHCPRCNAWVTASTADYAGKVYNCGGRWRYIRRHVADWMGYAPAECAKTLRPRRPAVHVETC